MATTTKNKLITVEEYLASEIDSPVKREYVGGAVYAMGEFLNVHNVIAGNILGNLYPRLRRQRYHPCNSATKIRVRLPDHTRFYYPDASIVGRQNSPHDYYHDEPAAIFEVLSRFTRRYDEVEKKDAYLTIPSLEVYVLVETEIAAVVVYRRTAQGFVREDYVGLEAVIPLPEIETELPLAEVYEGVEFSPEIEPESDV